MEDYTNKWLNYKKVIMVNNQQHANDIDVLLNMLHEEQLSMIDRAVEASDLRDARELITYIKGL